MGAESSSGQSRLFATCFMAIVATSFCFIIRAMVIDAWGVEFGLSETQKGELFGAGLWPFAISIVLLSLVIDRLGFKTTLWFAALCHAVGLAVLLTATGYWTLYIGTFIMALGNGAVEAAVNPAIASAYTNDRPKHLNRLHAGWPGGLILGGVAAIALVDFDWRVKVALMALPIVIYGVLLVGQKFPISERVASGVSYRQMLAEAGWLSAFVIIALMALEVGRVAGLSTTVVVASIAVLTLLYAFVARSPGRPLFVILVLLMIPLATTELSTDSWITSLMTPRMEAIGIQAGWVLVYTSALMFVTRIFAGPVLKLLKPLGTLAFASGLAAVGLFMLSSATGLALLAAATLYGIGKSFFWGTTLGVVSEQFPKGGAVTLNIVAGAGMLAAGVVGSVLLGFVQDRAVSDGLARHDAQNSAALSQTYLTQERTSVLGSYRALDPAAVEQAPPADRELIQELTDGAKQSALRYVAILPAGMLVAYLGLILWFRSRGGYKPVVLGASAH